MSDEIIPSENLDAQENRYVWLWNAIESSWKYIHECAAQHHYAYWPTVYPCFVVAESLPMPDYARVEWRPEKLKIPATVSDEIAAAQQESEQFSRAYGLLATENKMLREQLRDAVEAQGGGEAKS